MKVYINETDKRSTILASLFVKDGHTITDNIRDSDIVFAKKEIDVKLLKKGCHVYTLINNEKLKEYPYYYCLYTNEQFVYNNACLTSEALFSIIVQENTRSLYKSNVLVIGCGVCATNIISILKVYNANVTVATRNRKHYEMILASGMSYMPLENIKDEQFDFVINTVPANVIPDDFVHSLDNCKIYDIASSPYGSPNYKMYHHYYILEALPCKFAYKSAAELLYKAICKREDYYVKK